MPGAGYHLIAADLRAKIQRGDYPPGTAIPRHESIAVFYRVRRETVRRAIKELQAEGLLDPVIREGTFVRERHPIRLHTDRYRTVGSGMGPWETACAAQGLTGATQMVGVSWQSASKDIAADLNVSVGSRIVVRVAEMSIAGTVRQIQETCLPEHIAAGTALAEPDMLPGGIYAALTDAGYPPDGVEETVGSRMPTPGERDVLGLGLGSPVLEARRITVDEIGVPLVVTRVVVSADHVSFVSSQRL